MCCFVSFANEGGHEASLMTRVLHIVGRDDLVGGRAHVGDCGLASSIVPVVVPTS